MVNYLAWPHYLKVDSIKESELAAFARLERIVPPKYLEMDRDARTEDKTSVGLALAISECVSSMRAKMNSEISARIIIGGKVAGYSGILPGLVEEFILAYQARLPIFLIGAFGGCSKLLIKAISEKETPEKLKYNAQIRDVTEKLGLAKHYEEFKEKLSKRKDFKVEARNLILPISRYRKMERVISEIREKRGFSGLNNGLDKLENEVLFKTDDLRTINGLILKGIKKRLKNEKPINQPKNKTRQISNMKMKRKRRR